MAVKFYKICTWISVGLLLLAAVSKQALRLKYTREMPQAPQVESGRTVEVDGYYTKTVYVTKRESYGLYARDAAVVAALGLTILMNQLRRRAERKEDGRIT